MHGFFWVVGDRRSASTESMYVEWEAPAEVTKPWPIVLVHGGGGQGTDWLGTPDGRPGWAPLLVAQGWAVYVVDRPGHGRSPRSGRRSGPPATLDMIAGTFAAGTDERHTQWPGPGGADDPAVAQLAASAVPLAADLADAQAVEAERLAALLDQIGPAVLITHSFGAPAGWLTADLRPDLVRAVVALEPFGPPFLRLPEAGIALDWGLTSARLTYEPEAAAAADLDPGRPRSLPNLRGFPIAVVEAEASVAAAACAPTAEFLRTAGADVTHLRLAEHGVRGNGHGFIVERNNDAALAAVLAWLEPALRVFQNQQEHS